MNTLVSHEIDADHGTHKATVQALEHPCGLLTYRIPDDFEPDTAYVWRIGHHSGLCVAAAHTETDAIAGVAILADITDWTAEHADVLRALPGRLAKEIWQRLNDDHNVIHPRYR